MMTDIFSFMPNWLNFIVRILIACICGFVIGFERKSRSKEAGIRTHTIVCLGSALMMIISKYAFWDAVTGDGARIAAQIVSGIGFLGTGMIVYSRGTLHGLTTAAGIWATAGVGMAIGAGGTVMLIIGLASTFLIVFVHLFLHLPLKIFRTKGYHQIQVQFVAENGAVDRIKELFSTDRIYRMRLNASDGKRVGTVLLKTSNMPPTSEWNKILDENSFITSIEYLEDEWS